SPPQGLRDEEIEQMPLHSSERAEEHSEARQLREQVVEAERILHDARKQLAAFPDLVPADERAQIEAAMARVETLRAEATEAGPLAEAIHALDEGGGPLVERIMNRARGEGLGGGGVGGGARRAGW